jgi:hypothetical protein
MSRRNATVQSLIGMLQITTDPETASVLQSMAIMNMEGEGISDVRDFFRQKLVKIGALEPTEEEAAEMAAAKQTKSPEDMALEGMAEEAQAKAVKARADVLKVVADVGLTEAKTVETLAEIDMGSMERAITLSEKMAPQAQPIVQEVAQPMQPPITQPMNPQAPPLLGA